MKVLIVDDQYDSKVRAASSILRDLGVDTLKHVMCAFDAMREMASEQYDLLILDLHIPQRLGDDIDPEGGRSLLQYVELNHGIKKPTVILGITAQRDAFDHASDFFKARGWTLLLDADGGGLRAQLESILRTQMSHLGNGGTRCDAFIITALTHTELEAVLSLQCNWEQFKLEARPEIFYRGTFEDKTGKVRHVVATSLPSMGMTAAAVISAYVSNIFRPQYLIMAGIAAGIPGKANFGDILIASPSWDWGSGKLTVRDGSPYFMSAPTQVALDPELHALLSAVSADKRYMAEIFIGWKDKKPLSELQVRIGPLASGAVVLEDPSTVDLIRSQNRATIGIEMEAFGVMSATYYSGNGGPRAIVAKSVCDFADPHKNDDWQKYAAYTSAQFVYRLLTRDLTYK